MSIEKVDKIEKVETIKVEKVKKKLKIKIFRWKFVNLQVIREVKENAWFLVLKIEI